MSGVEPVLLPDTDAQDRPVPRRRTARRHARLGIALLVTAIGLSGVIALTLHFTGAQFSVDRSRLTIATVEHGTFVRDIAAEGQVVAADSPTLYSPASGHVMLKVHAGDPVERDQVVATVENPDLTAKLSQEEANLENLRFEWRRAQLDADRTLAQLQEAYQQAEIDQKTAQREYDRTRKAYERGAYSELQALRAQDTLEKATFAFKQARLNYDSQPDRNRFDVGSRKALFDRQQYLVADLHRQIDALQIRSPVSGSVGQLQIADRASVAKDTPLLTVVDLSALEVEIKVPESLAPDLAPGMSADLEGDGHHWKGSISAVAPQVVAGEVSARLRFTDASPRKQLRQNQRLSVRLFLESRDNVLMVDRGTFMDQDGGGSAYVVHGNVATRRPVRLGAASVQKVEIRAGVTAGDQIVISGTEAFHNAERVILAN